MNSRLQDWIDSNKLSVIEKKGNVFSVEGFGDLFYLEPMNIQSDDGKTVLENKIITPLFTFAIDSEKVFDSLENGEYKYILFEFGKKFYYSPVKKSKDGMGNFGFVPEFNDFKNIGTINEDSIAEFVHLGVHSEYELMNGSGVCEDWVKKGAFLKSKALGICDRNTLGGTLSFQMSCSKKEIKPIFGETITIAYDYDEGKDIQETHELKLYVKNKEGWRNLLHINNKINVEHGGLFIPEQDVLENLSGLFVVFSKESIYNYSINDFKNLKQIVKRYTEKAECFYQIDSVIFEVDELDLHNLQNIRAYIVNQLVEPILINDSYYIDKEYCDLKEMLNKLDRRSQPSSKDQYFKTINDTYDNFNKWLDNDKLYSTLLTATENTIRLADACDFKIETGLRKLPRYRFVEDSEKLFYDLIQKGISEKLSDVKDLQPYLDRIETECRLLVGAQIVDFFLILWDIIKWSKSSGILVGSGRGSVGGSLVAYLLDITTVDPIKYDLLFERFLNEARLSGERAKSADSMPDVDVDFMGERREEVRDYIRKRFGEDKVCCVGAYGRMKLKTCLKDFGRMKGLPFDKINFITKELNDWQEYTFTDFVEAAAQNDKLMDFFQSNPDIINLTKYALMQAKTSSIHASAMIIVPDEDEDGESMNIHSWMPMKMLNGILVSEWEGKYVERAGFLKEDILGLKQLDKFCSTLAEIKKNRNKTVVLEEIPNTGRMADLTFEYFQKGLNEDIFQFGTPGLKTYSVKVHPTEVEHLIAMSALYRPGPMDSNAHIDFADIKKGKKQPVYDYGLREVTKKTSGLYIYQEQVMQAVHVLGGLSLVQADELRTYIKKFDEKKMKQFKEQFVLGAIKNGCPENEAENIWKKLLAFSGYGFNRSHSAAYSLMSYWSQYLKAAYPLEFWTTALQFADEDEIPDRLSEFQKLDLDTEILPPDINYSDKRFVSDSKLDKIYWAMTKIKGVGDIAVDNILMVRKNGPFLSLEDFMKRVPKNKVNKRVVESLIIAGAFDQLYNIDLKRPLDRVRILKEFFDLRKEDLPDNYKVRLANKSYFWTLLQKDLTGYGIVDYKELLTNKVSKPSLLKKYMSIDEALKSKQYTQCLVAGRILDIIVTSGKKGDKRARVMLESDNQTVKIMFWSDAFESLGERLVELKGKMIGLTAKVKEFNERKELMADDDAQLFEL
jgi:DNA polymerase-3 subunit alpha